jgi:hypothetical protein
MLITAEDFFETLFTQGFWK